MSEKVDRRGYLKLAGGIVAGAAIASVGWGAYMMQRPPETAPPTTVTVTNTVTKTVTTTPTVPKWNWAEVAKPWSGTTIRAIAETTPTPVWTAKTFAPEFEELTGIKVEFENVSYDEMFRKEITDMEEKSGIYDVIYTEQDIIANFYARGYLTNLTDELMGAHPELNYPDWDLADIFAANNYAFKGKLYSVPLETMIKTYVYRKDKFDELGLKPARTIDELKENAEALCDPGADFWGWACNAKAYQALGYEFCESWWWLYDLPHWCLNFEGWEDPDYVYSFEKFPAKPRVSQAEGGYMDTEKAFEALADYLELIKYAPPGVRTYTWDESATAIANGKVGQGIQYGDFYGLFIDPNQSVVVGKVYADLPPVSKYYRQGRPIGYFNLGAWSIPASSKRKEPAWLFIQYATAKEQVARVGVATGAPQRMSVLMSDEISRLDRELYGGYFSVIRNYRDLFWGNPPLVEHFPILEIIWTHLARAVAGEFGPVPEPASPKDTTDPYNAAKNCMLAMTQAVDAKLKEFYP